VKEADDFVASGDVCSYGAAESGYRLRQSHFQMEMAFIFRQFLVKAFYDLYN